MADLFEGIIDKAEAQDRRIADLERQLAEARNIALEEAAVIIENGSFGYGHVDVATVHARWIREAKEER